MGDTGLLMLVFAIFVLLMPFVLSLYWGIPDHEERFREKLMQEGFESVWPEEAGAEVYRRDGRTDARIAEVCGWQGNTEFGNGALPSSIDGESNEREFSESQTQVRHGASRP